MLDEGGIYTPPTIKLTEPILTDTNKFSQVLFTGRLISETAYGKKTKAVDITLLTTFLFRHLIQSWQYP